MSIQASGKDAKVCFIKISSSWLMCRWLLYYIKREIVSIFYLRIHLRGPRLEEWTMYPNRDRSRSRWSAYLSHMGDILTTLAPWYNMHTSDKKATSRFELKQGQPNWEIPNGMCVAAIESVGRHNYGLHSIHSGKGWNTVLKTCRCCRVAKTR